MPGSLWTLQDRVVIVTGAAQGIGQAAADLLIALGASVVAVDVNASGLDSWADDKPGDRVLTATGSVADPVFAERIVTETVDRFGIVTGLVNNAGIVRAAMIDKMTTEQWQSVIDVNLTGAFNMLQAVGRAIITAFKAGKSVPAAIVNVTSDAGRRGTIGQINYGAAKAGMFGLTMSAAREWARYGIRVNSVAFGVVETPMTEVIRGEKFRDRMLDQIPLGRFAAASEVVPPIGFLLSDAASYVTGQNLSVNGGYTIGF